jgi:hypothetical protein
MSSTGSGYTYTAGTTHTLLVSNSLNSANIKHVSLHMELSIGATFPQNAGAIYNSALWPSLASSNGPLGQPVPTGASVVTGSFHNDIYEAWDIFPQPSNETLTLDYPALDSIGRVYEVDVLTICIPIASIPEPAPLTLVVIGAFSTILWGARVASWTRKT